MAIVIHVLQTLQNLPFHVVFAEIDKEMYQDL